MPMTPEERKAELVRRKTTAAAVARSLGVARAHVSQVLAGTRRSPRVESEVARIFEMAVEDVFGERSVVAIT